MFKELLESLDFDLNLNTANEIKNLCNDIVLAESVPKECIDELHHFAVDSPIEDGNELSKATRDYLLDNNLIARIMVKGEHGWCAITPKGYSVYKIITNLIKINKT